MRRLNPAPCLLACLGLALLPALASADVLFSFDYHADVLVTVDTDAATISVVAGPVLPSDSRSSLALHGGLLYFYRYTACSNSWLASLSLDGLTAEFWTAVQLGGAALVNRVAGGMDSNGSQMYASLTTSCGGKRDQLAQLSTSGVLSNVVDYSSFGVGFDLLAFSPNGDLYALEGSFGATASIYLVDDTPNVTLIGSHGKTASDNGSGVYTGLTFTPGGRLWVVETVVTGGIPHNNLREIDPATGQILTDVILSYPENPDDLLTGLAYAPGGTPVDATSWGRLKTLYR